MVSKRLSIFGFISAAALVSGVLIGCGGSSATSPAPSPSSYVTGNLKGATGSVTSFNPATQQVQVNVGGSPVSAQVPVGETPALGAPIAVIPPGTPIINGLTEQGAAGGKVHLTPGFTPYHLFSSIDAGKSYQDTGITITPLGALSGPLALTAGQNVILTTGGPYTIISGSFPAITQLTVQTFTFGLVVNAQGVASIPTFNGKLPSNGGTTAGTNFVQVTYPTPAFSTGTGTLTITGLVSGSKIETVGITAGSATYNDAFNNGVQDAIPSGGVSTVQFMFTQP